MGYHKLVVKLQKILFEYWDVSNVLYYAILMNNYIIISYAYVVMNEVKTYVCNNF